MKYALTTLKNKCAGVIISIHKNRVLAWINRANFKAILTNFKYLLSKSLNIYKALNADGR